MKKILLSMLIGIIFLGVTGCDSMEQFTKGIKEKVGGRKTQSKEIEDIKKEIKEEVREEQEKQKREKQEKEKQEVKEKEQKEQQLREDIRVEIENEYEEKYRYDSSLDTAWQNQYFLDTDYKGRVRYQMDEYLSDQLDSLPFPVRYQAYYGGGPYNFSIKLCLKGINGDSKILANQRQILLNLFAQYNYETESKIQNVYFFNIDNTANYQYSFNNSTGNFVRD